MRRTRIVQVVAAGAALAAAALGGLQLAAAYRRWAQSRIKLVDDFNDGKDPNLIGGKAVAEGAPGGRISHAVLRVQTPSPGELACAISYDVARGATASWSTGLNELDISAARDLRFWIRVEQGPGPELRVALADSAGGAADVELPRIPAGRWRRVVLPVRAFGGVDFNRLSRFSLRIAMPSEPGLGRLSLDDLAFTGPTELFFRSLEDNLAAPAPRRAIVSAQRIAALPSDDMLRAVAADTWGYFRDMVDVRHQLPLNFLQTRPTRAIGDYASTTDIALYLLSVVSAADLDLLDRAAAVARIQGTLDTLLRLPTWRGFYYNYYSTTNLQIANQYISSVDNGWLAGALIVIRQAFPELTEPATRLLDAMDFGVFFDPQNGQIRLGYDMEHEQFAPYHYGLLSTEARIISVIAIGKGDLPPAHWFRIYRTLPKEWAWQRQAPEGAYTRIFDYDLFQGSYAYAFDGRTVRIVPSWGGSLFEFLMPTLLVDEPALSPFGLGLNDRRAVDVHIHYAREERGYPVWGISPCATPGGRHGGYAEFGVPGLGSKGYKDEAVVTPHASMLALAVAPGEARDNIRELLRRYRVYGPYGLYDAVDVKTGEVAHRYLALDQGMSLVALNNALNQGAIQRRFSSDPVLQRMIPLLGAERFFPSEGADAAR